MPALRDAFECLVFASLFWSTLLLTFNSVVFASSFYVSFLSAFDHKPCLLLILSVFHFWFVFCSTMLGPSAWFVSLVLGWYFLSLFLSIVHDLCCLFFIVVSFWFSCWRSYLLCFTGLISSWALRAYEPWSSSAPAFFSINADTAWWFSLMAYCSRPSWQLSTS